jgi:hypothetical protein
VERIVEADPEVILSKAEELLIPVGYHVSARSETSVTFTGRPAVPGELKFWTAGMALFAPVLSGLSTTAIAARGDESVTLLVRPTGDGKTQVILPDDEGTAATKLLTLWIRADVLRERMDESIMTLAASYRRLVIFPDRVELHTRKLRWKVRDSVEIEDIASVGGAGGRLKVVATDGRVFEVSWPGMGADVARAAELIERRREVYASPPI